MATAWRPVLDPDLPELIDRGHARQKGAFILRFLFRTSSIQPSRSARHRIPEPVLLCLSLVMRALRAGGPQAQASMALHACSAKTKCRNARCAKPVTLFQKPGQIPLLLKNPASTVALAGVPSSRLGERPYFSRPAHYDGFILYASLIFES
jgi:hypothetical protein